MGMSCRVAGMPDSMIVAKECMSGPLDVATRTLSHVTDWMGIDRRVEAAEATAHSSTPWTVDATSSSSCIWVGKPVGWSEMLSAALCFTPGTCIIRNWWRRVFS